MLNITTLPYSRYVGIKHAKDWALTNDLILEQWIVPKGTVVRLINGQNFGYVILPEFTKDVRNFVIPRRIFKY